MSEHRDPPDSPWKTLSRDLRYDNPWIRVTESKVIHPGGGQGVYGIVHFKNLAVGVLPLDRDGNTWLVGQYRYALSAYSWEIPEGGGKLDVDPRETALRELREETGLVAAKLTPIVKMHLSNSVSDELGFVFLGEDLTQGESHPDEDEQLVVRKVPFEEAYRMVERGEITDSLSVAGILKVKLLRS